SCTNKQAPMRVLTSIQESAWGNLIPRVDLPAVTFEYNRFQRSFGSTPIQQNPWSEEGSYFQRSLGWGIRRQGPLWPSVEGMFLDFDGDGLQDRIYVFPDGNECKFNWSKNLGRSPTTGLLQFET